MDTGKVYHDIEGNERTIWQMVKHEPEWAANRIQEGEKAIEELAALKASHQPDTEAKKIIKAALYFRKNWCDVEDEAELETGCDCEVCVFMRACDEYT